MEVMLLVVEGVEAAVNRHAKRQVGVVPSCEVRLARQEPVFGQVTESLLGNLL